MKTCREQKELIWKLNEILFGIEWKLIWKSEQNTKAESYEWMNEWWKGKKTFGENIMKRGEKRKKGNKHNNSQKLNWKWKWKWKWTTKQKSWFVLCASTISFRGDTLRCVLGQDSFLLSVVPIPCWFIERQKPSCDLLGVVLLVQEKD